MKFLCQGVQKLYPEQTETQTDRQMHRHTDRHEHLLVESEYVLVKYMSQCLMNLSTSQRV